MVRSVGVLGRIAQEITSASHVAGASSRRAAAGCASHIISWTILPGQRHFAGQPEPKRWPNGRLSPPAPCRWVKVWQLLTSRNEERPRTGASTTPAVCRGRIKPRPLSVSASRRSRSAFSLDRPARQHREASCQTCSPPARGPSSRNVVAPHRIC